TDSSGSYSDNAQGSSSDQKIKNNDGTSYEASQQNQIQPKRTTRRQPAKATNQTAKFLTPVDQDLSTLRAPKAP
ncbi:hypothetical protein P5F04_16265, partial [Clostridium perfringens]|nr:hypothetical protein [Clostridium perfringens]